MKTTKYLFAILLSSLFVLSSFESKAIKIVIGTRSHPDGNGGCTGDKGICIIIGIPNASAKIVGTNIGDNMGTADLQLLSKSQAKFDILTDNAKDNSGNIFVVEKDVYVGSEIAAALGAKSVLIRAGTYKVDYSKFLNGSVVVNVVTQ